MFVAWVAVCATLGVDPVYAWIGTAERHFGALTWALCGLLFVAGHALETGLPSAESGARGGIHGRFEGAGHFGTEPDWFDLATAGLPHETVSR